MIHKLDIFTKDLQQDKELNGDSLNWANWQSSLSIVTCQYCKDQHGKICDISILNGKTNVNAHPNCICIYVPMRTKAVGTATDMGLDGADFYLMFFGALPGYYIDKKALNKLGWNNGKKKVSSILPGKMIGGDDYDNSDDKLPYAPDRKWYEADINYTSGKRNNQRIVYSNDGLIFVTYDHYHTFYEITQ